jgi:hypothetical protein
MRKHPYGRNVVGQAEVDAQRTNRQEKRSVYGRLVGDAPAAPAIVPAGPPPLVRARPRPARLTEGPLDVADASISVRALEELLDRAPHELDRCIDLEFERPDPRKGAFRAFLAVEMRRPAGARDNVLAAIELGLVG